MHLVVVERAEVLAHEPDEFLLADAVRQRLQAHRLVAPFVEVEQLSGVQVLHARHLGVGEAGQHLLAHDLVGQRLDGRLWPVEGLLIALGPLCHGVELLGQLVVLGHEELVSELLAVQLGEHVLLAVGSPHRHFPSRMISFPYRSVMAQ